MISHDNRTTDRYDVAVIFAAIVTFDAKHGERLDRSMVQVGYDELLTRAEIVAATLAAEHVDEGDNWDGAVWIEVLEQEWLAERLYMLDETSETAVAEIARQLLAVQQNDLDKTVEVDGAVYVYDADSVCYAAEADDDEEGPQFWFYHGLTCPTAEQITTKIRANLPSEEPAGQLFAVNVVATCETLFCVQAPTSAAAESWLPEQYDEAVEIGECYLSAEETRKSYKVYSLNTQAAEALAALAAADLEA